MAEMTTLVAAVYRKYNTNIAKGFEGKTPAITSRFELFYDVTMPEIEASHRQESKRATETDTGMQEHVCMIKFTEQA